MRATMNGAGYVGLVSEACLADFGHVVTCVDKDSDKIDGLKRGEIPIHEPGSHELVTSNSARNHLYSRQIWPKPREKLTPFSLSSGRLLNAATDMRTLHMFHEAACELTVNVDRFAVVAASQPRRWEVRFSKAPDNPRIR